MAIVTISRGTMSGGEALANLLSERLECPAISREVIRDAASHYGIAENLLTEQLTKVPSVLQRRFGIEDRRQYLVAIQTALAERAQEGDFIYHGHAGHLLLKELPNVFKVRLIAPMDHRIRYLMEREGISEEEARKRIETVDRGRVQWTRFLYDVDWQDPALYDVVINLAHITPEAACSMIKDAVAQPEFQPCENNKKIVDWFALSCQIKLKLAQDDRTRGMHIDMTVSGEIARVSGKFLSTGPLIKGLRKSEDDVVDVIRHFPQIKKVEFSLEDAGVPVET